MSEFNNNKCMYTTQGDFVCNSKNDSKSSFKRHDKSNFVSLPVYPTNSDLIGINTIPRPIDPEEVIPKVADFKFM